MVVEDEQEEDVSPIVPDPIDNTEEPDIDSKCDNAKEKEKAEDDDMIEIHKEMSEARVSGLVELHNAHVFTGKIRIKERRVPVSINHGIKKTEKKNLYIVNLNLYARHSHPLYRDMLKAIKIFAHMLSSTAD